MSNVETSIRLFAWQQWSRHNFRLLTLTEKREAQSDDAADAMSCHAIPVPLLTEEGSMLTSFSKPAISHDGLRRQSGNSQGSEGESHVCGELSGRNEDVVECEWNFKVDDVKKEE
jgi:hypothetical protein